MKKISYFLMLFTMLNSFGLNAKNSLVKSATELISTYAAAQDGDTVSLAPGYYNVSNKVYFPTTGIITLTSQYPDNKDSIAILAMNMQGANIADGVKAGLIFESLHLQHNNPTATSGHIIYYNKFYGNIAKLVFHKCEISNGVRGLFRSVKPTDAAYTSCGDMEYLEMTECLVHNTFVTSGNNWPLLYLGHLPVEVKIENNTFYDLAYMKSIFTMNYADPNSGRNAKFDFKNNTVCTTAAGNLISTGSYLGEETEFNIENNVFALPNWTNALNMPTDDAKYYSPAIISCKGGIITAKNNVKEGMKPWIAGQTLDTEGQGGFVVIDTTNTYTMADLDFTWSDFADPEYADYSNLSTKKLATSGVDGAPIGDKRWVKNFTNPKVFSATYAPDSIVAVITPRRAFYEGGSSVTVSASNIDGYTFNGWRKPTDNTLISKDNPYIFNITADTEVRADYGILEPRTVAITISGSASATYVITPAKDFYFDGDEVTVTLNKHFINEFTGWSDGNQDLTRTLTVSGSNIALTANFTEHPYKLCWDFDQLTGNNQTFTSVPANHTSDPANVGYMIYMVADTVSKVETRNNKFTAEGKDLYNCLTRKTPIENTASPSYIYIKFSTKGMSNLKVKSIYATDNSFFKVQKMEYSVNGGAYTTFATDTISGNIDQVWRPFDAVLPTVLENQDSVAIRWISDPTTEQLFVTGVTSYALEQIYITNIIIIDSNFTDVKNTTADTNFKIYSGAKKIFIDAKENGKVSIYNIMGQKVKESTLNAGINEFAGFKTGIYIVNTGSTVQKVLIK